MATRYNYTGGIVTNGLVLNLDAAKTDSYPGTGTTWRDISGNNNNGTLTNGPTFSGISKQASIVFDGTNDFITQQLNTGSFNTEASLCMFLKLPANQPGNNGGLMTLGNVSSSISTQYPATHYPYTNGLGYFSTFRTNRVDSITLSPTVDKGIIHMLTITTTPGSNGWKLYQNSSLVHQITGENTVSLSDLKIGKSENRVGTVGGIVADYYFQGNIYNIQMYNRALSQAEITQNFNALRGRYGI